MKDHMKIFKALANETRLSIMALLGEQELCVCQIEKALKISQAKASRHLTVLKNAGLVKSRRQGLWMYYSAVKPAGNLRKEISKILGDLEKTIKWNKTIAENHDLCAARQDCGTKKSSH